MFRSNTGCCQSGLHTYSLWVFILCQHLGSFLLPFFLPYLLSSQRVTVIVSWQHSEVTVLLWVEVEPGKLCQNKSSG